jgi:hypothetical protein
MCGIFRKYVAILLFGIALAEKLREDLLRSRSGDRDGESFAFEDEPARELPLESVLDQTSGCLDHVRGQPRELGRVRSGYLQQGLGRDDSVQQN